MGIRDHEATREPGAQVAHLEPGVEALDGRAKDPLSARCRCALLPVRVAQRGAANLGTEACVEAHVRYDSACLAVNERGKDMGFLRKSLFLGTNGASGLFFKANSKKERTANALEKQVRIQREAARAEQAQAAGEAREARQQRVAAGAWWLEDRAFKKAPSYIHDVRYLGGWPDHPLDEAKPEVKTLSLDAGGLHFKGLVATVFTIEWSSVATLSIEPDPALATDPASEDPAEDFPAAPAKALVVARARSGNAIRFLVTGVDPGTLQGKMAPLLRRMAEGNARRDVLEGNGSGAVSASSVDSVADELTKLAPLRDAGVLSDKEFAGQKERLLRGAT